LTYFTISSIIPFTWQHSKIRVLPRILTKAAASVKPLLFYAYEAERGEATTDWRECGSLGSSLLTI